MYQKQHSNNAPILSQHCSPTNLQKLQCSTTKWFVLHRMKESYMIYNKHINTNDFKFL